MLGCYIKQFECYVRLQDTSQGVLVAAKCDLLETLCVQTEQCRKVTCQVKSLGTQGKAKFIWLSFSFFFLTFQLAEGSVGSQHESSIGRAVHEARCGGGVYSGLCVVVTVQVKVTEFVQVPVWEIC